MVKYTFIHPTKSGGTAVERYFENYYSDFIIGKYHNEICTNTNNPIIIVRDVKDRFFSMFKYWKNGSSLYKRDKSFKDKHKNTSIFDFIELLKKKEKELYHDFTWEQHFNNTSDWIGNTDYKNIIIIKYEDDLNEKINTLIDYLCIPNKHILLYKINISFNEDKEILNNNYVNEFIKDYFKEDIKLLNIININPELFKCVI